MQYNTTLDYTNVNGAMPLLFSIKAAVPYAFSILLLIVWFTLTAGQYFIIKNKTGRGKALVALLVSSIVLVVLSILLVLANLVTFIDPLFYGFCSILFFVLYELSDNW